MPGDHENIVKLDADHGDVCRFDRSQHDEDNLELVQGNIRDIYDNALKLGELTRAVPADGEATRSVETSVESQSESNVSVPRDASLETRLANLRTG